MRLARSWQYVLVASFCLLSPNFIFAGLKDGILNVCDDISDPLTLDPQKEFQEKNHILLQQIYDGLVRFDPDGKIEADLAISWDRIDPLRVRFKLRHGVVFHNGEPFNAESVRFSISRYLDPKTGFPALGFVNSIDHAEIVDEYTIDIVTKFPDGLLLNRLAGFILISPPKYIAEKGDDALQFQPIGTGPFQFVRWEKGKEIVLVANKDYWMKGYPKIQGLIFKFIPTEEQFDNLISGNIDIITELQGTRTLDVMSSRVATVFKRASFYTVVGSIALKGPLKDKRVRQAMNYAINRAEIIRYDLLGNGDAIATLTMAGEEGHNPNLKPYPFNLTKARQLMKEAGYEHGFTLNMLAKEQGMRVAGIVKKELESLNIKVNLSKTYDASVIKDISQKPWDVFLAGCPDPMVHSFFIPSIFIYSKSPYSITRDDDFDRRLEAMVTTLDKGQRELAGEELDKYVYDESLSLFTYQKIRTYALRKGVKWVPYVSGMPYFYEAYFDDPNKSPSIATEK